ncbi:hypothetical protein ACWEC4_41520, partial [Streptomyces sp. NPDC005055]
MLINIQDPAAAGSTDDTVTPNLPQGFPGGRQTTLASSTAGGLSSPDTSAIAGIGDGVPAALTCGLVAGVVAAMTLRVAVGRAETTDAMSSVEDPARPRAVPQSLAGARRQLRHLAALAESPNSPSMRAPLRLRCTASAAARRSTRDYGTALSRVGDWRGGFRPVSSPRRFKPCVRFSRTRLS